MNHYNRSHHLKLCKTPQPAYPNAADPAYFASKALNVITALVSGMGFISAMVFLVTMV